MIKVLEILKADVFSQFFTILIKCFIDWLQIVHCKHKLSDLNDEGNHGNFCLQHLAFILNPLESVQISHNNCLFCSNCLSNACAA